MSAIWLRGGACPFYLLGKIFTCHCKQCYRPVLLTTDCYFCHCTISYCTLFFLPIHPPTHTHSHPHILYIPRTQPLFITLSQVWYGFQDEVVLLSVISNLLNSMAPFTTVCVCAVCVILNMCVYVVVGVVVCVYVCVYCTSVCAVCVCTCVCTCMCMCVVCVLCVYVLLYVYV